MNIGKAIEDLRVNKLGLTQSDFAKKLYKNQRTISGYELNIIIPPAEFLSQIVEEFNVKFEITKSGVTIKESRNMEELARKEMYNFIINNVVDDDFTQEDLFNYDEIISNHKEQLPERFEEGVKDLGLDKSKIVGAISKDEYSQLCIYYLGDFTASVLLYCCEEYNQEWNDKKYKFIYKDENSLDKYTFYKNSLWVAYVQRDIETMTKEELINAFYSSVYSLWIYNDSRLKNLEDMDIEALKQYTNDYSNNKEYVDAIVSVCKKLTGEKYIKIEAAREGEIYREDTLELEQKLIKIPSGEILICQNEFYEEFSIIVKDNYFKTLKKLLSIKE